MTGAAAPAVSRLAAFGLSGDGTLWPTPLDPLAWNALVGRVVIERMEGMLAGAVVEGALAASETQMEEVRRLARSRARADLRLERETLAVSGLLDEAGISHRIIKGPAWSHSAYPDPMMRGFGDVDVLVEPRRWYEAIARLETWGAKRVLPELTPGFDARFGKDATLLSTAQIEIDLHRTLVLGPYGLWIDCDELLARPAASIRVGGASLPVLDADAAFLHACYNAALADDPPRLMALRDVAQMALAGHVSPDAVVDLTRRWRGSSVVRRAFRLVTRYLGYDMSTTPFGRAVEGQTPLGDRLLLSSYRGPARGYTSQLAGLAAIKGTRARATYLNALVRPQAAYLEARGYGRLGYARHVMGKLRRSGT